MADIVTGNSEGMDSLVIIPAAERKYMIDKIPYFYRQDTDFRYLTGCLQPDCVLVIETSKKSCKSILFAKQNSEHEEKWEGCRIGLTEAVSFFGVDQAAPLPVFEKYLHEFCKNNPTSKVWYEFMEPRNPNLHKQIMAVLQDTHSFQNLSPPRPILHSIRSIKSPSEIILMQESANIASQAIKETIHQTKHLSTEAQINACIEYKCKMGGAEFLAYPSVVAAGNNANTIHYIANTGSLQEDDLVLVDAGCEFHGYSSDITRTWPVGGTFTGPQKCVYEAVLDTQEQLIKRISSATVSIDGLYSLMLEILAKNLIEIGLISSKIDALKVSRATRQFCPHHVSHYLGMDVHDTPLVSKCQDLMPGMVITVEPGVYIPRNNTCVEECFRGIGVRIEDDVLVTNDGCEVLSSGCPKSVQEIEDLIRGGNI